MSSVLDRLVPPRLGRDVRWLLASSWTSNLGDGLALAAGPLLVASQTDDARVVALAALLQWLPQLLFGLLAGALADRLDRRRLVIAVDLVRTAVLVVLASALATGAVSTVVVLAALFAVATAEVFADNTTSTLLPMLVARDDLALGNARVQTGYVTVNQLVGPPLGAALFTVGAQWAVATQAVLVLAGALLVSRIALPIHDTARPTTHLRADIAEGVRWVAHNRAVRTLVLTIVLFNVTYGAAWSVLVLLATERLQMGEVGFGLLTAASAVGGVAGTTCYGMLTRRFTLGGLMRAGLVIETLTHLTLAVTTTPAVALAVMVVFGAHAFVWGTTSITVRQRAVPLGLQGRVNSVNSIGVFGGLVAGAAVGGVLARSYGVTAPFWFGFAGSAVLCVALWRELAHIAHDEIE